VRINIRIQTANVGTELGRMTMKLVIANIHCQHSSLFSML